MLKIPKFSILVAAFALLNGCNSVSYDENYIYGTWKVTDISMDMTDEAARLVSAGKEVATSQYFEFLENDIAIVSNVLLESIDTLGYTLDKENLTILNNNEAIKYTMKVINENEITWTYDYMEQGKIILNLKRQIE